jgi:hypothetical protein
MVKPLFIPKLFTIYIKLLEPMHLFTPAGKMVLTPGVA